MQTKVKNTIWKAILLGVAINLFAYTIALAASGDLDITFDGDGLAITDVNVNRSDVVWNVAVQGDGKIVAVGDSYKPNTATRDIALVRYNTDGTMDTTFSGDGKVITNLGGIDQGMDLVIQSNGKIVVAGQRCNNAYTICDVAVLRYNSDGTLDTTFSGDGKVWTDFGGNDNGSFGGLAVMSNGKIIVSGYMWNGNNYDMTVHRYKANGALDKTFSGDGKAKINFGQDKHDFAYALIPQSDGKLLIAGASCAASCNFALARLNANGSLDKTFSGDGKQTTNFGGDDYANAIALQPDGKIVAVGVKYVSNLTYFAVARYNTNGSLDTTFNSTGKSVFNIIPSSNSFATSVLVQSDNNIVIAGSVDNGGADDFALVRLDSSGALDTTFSGDGIVTIDFGGDDFLNTLALQPLDGNYVLGGSSDSGGQRNFALARVLP